MAVTRAIGQLRTRAGWLGHALALGSLCACASEPQDAPGDPASAAGRSGSAAPGGTGGTSSTGGAGGTSSTGGTGGVSSVPTSGAQSSAGASGSDAASGGSGAATLSACGDYMAAFSIDEDTASVAEYVSNLTVVGREDWIVQMYIGDLGLGVVRGTGPGVMPPDFAASLLESLAADQPAPIDTAVLMPRADTSSTGPIVCVPPDTGSSLRKQGEQVELTLTGASVLGPCPGASIEGTLRFCQRSPCPSGVEIGAAHGTAWTPTLTSSGWSRLERAHQLSFNDDSMAVATTTGQLDPFVWAVILTDVDGPFAGEVLCAGGRFYEQDTGAAEPAGIYEFTELSTLGSCPDGGTTELKACLP